ncbi:MAG: molybdate ABC transporter substrate-binding protein [Methanomicrobiaceae archaeon]|nr:molybdate ABC transporter substrate-binding protein [Methanomicrobiaceae archaeon]
MKRITFIVFIGLVVCAALFACGCTESQPAETGTPEAEAGGSLLVYCGAGMREPMDEIADLFEEQEGITIQYTYGGSAQLLSQIELYQTGDAYMPGATSYIDSAIAKGFVDKTEKVVYHVMAMVVPKGNPAGIQTLEDLTKPGVRVAIGEPTGPAVGQAAKKMLEKDGMWEAVEANCVVKSGTVNELLVYVSMNQADAAIIWEDLYNEEAMDLIDIPLEEGFVKVVPIGTLTFSENPENAEKFIRFVASDEGLAIFEKHGFTTYPDEKYGM